MKCKNCKRSFESKVKNQYGRQKFCCEGCRTKYEIEHRNKTYKEYQKKWWVENKDKIRGYKAKRHDKILEYERKRKKTKAFKDKLKEEYQKNKEKFLARQKANKYITIPKGKLCEICNKELAKYKHHNNYSKPLEVIFCCSMCHNKLDRGLVKK